MFVPGILELLIIFTIGAMILFPIFIVVAFWRSGKFNASVPDGRRCLKCQSVTLPNADFCHQCGTELKPPLHK